MAPTRAYASDKDNVIPSQGRGPRRLPGPARRRRRATRASASMSSSARCVGDYEVEFTDSVVGNSSPARPRRSPSAIAASLAEFDPDAAHRADRDAPGSATATGSARRSTRRPSTASARSASSICSGCAARPRRRRARRGRRRRARRELLRRPLQASARMSEPASANGSGGQAPKRLRLGGMAMRNGLLIHGPTSWAVAARAQDGSIEVASGPKPSLARGRLASTPLIRGPAAARRGDGGHPARPGCGCAPCGFRSRIRAWWRPRSRASPARACCGAQAARASAASS